MSSPLSLYGSGRLECAKALLEAGASIEARNIVRSTPLQMAAEHKHLEVVQLLVSKGADLEAHNKVRRHDRVFVVAYRHLSSFIVVYQVMATALLIAADVGCLQVAEVLLESGCDVHARNHVDASALAIAADCDRVDLLAPLVEAGVDLEAGNQVCLSCLVLCCQPAKPSSLPSPLSFVSIQLQHS